MLDFEKLSKALQAARKDLVCSASCDGCPNEKACELLLALYNVADRFVDLLKICD